VAGTGTARSGVERLPWVFERLRAVAASTLGRERQHLPLGATALVHEAYLRLVDETQVPQWEGRWHFFAAAAEAMRRILVDRARAKRRLKRGGGRRQMDLDNMDFTVAEPPDELLDLDAALDRFAQEHPAKAQLVKLRYFAGLSTEEAAQALNISVRTAGRDWAYARAWLYDRIRSDQ
jgi:RNA polymerase sigma factor (TIGR02999 family)